MEINAETLYKVALEQVMSLQKQVIELNALYIEAMEKMSKMEQRDDELNV